MNALERIRNAKIHNEAEGYLELGLARQALECLGRLGDPAAFEVHALYLWGEGLRAMERYFEALVPLERAAKAAPEDTRVRMALSWCYKRTGRLDLAIATLREALVVEPTEPVLHYNLACYLSLAGQRRGACARWPKPSPWIPLLESWLTTSPTSTRYALIRSFKHSADAWWAERLRPASEVIRHSHKGAVQHQAGVIVDVLDRRLVDDVLRELIVGLGDSGRGDDAVAHLRTPVP